MRKPVGRKVRRPGCLLVAGAAALVTLWLLASSFSTGGGGAYAEPQTRSTGLTEVYASVWATELATLFNISSTSRLPPEEAPFKLGTVLDRIQARRGASLPPWCHTSQSAGRRPRPASTCPTGLPASP